MKQLPANYAEGNSRSEELFNQFLDAIEQYFNRYADVSFYAEQLNVSPRYLGQVTRAIRGRSPKSIIDECITSEIASQLASTNRPLKDIARWARILVAGPPLALFQAAEGHFSHRI